MRRSRTLARIRNNEVVRMCCVGHFIPAYIKHASLAGYDCIWLDMEHRCFDDRQIQTLLAFCHLFDIDCMVRPSTRERGRLYRYLEDGAAGLMIPHVSTPEAAQELVEAVKFPPIGNRGLDGAGLDSNFFHDPVDEYVDFANRETFLVVQIETPEAIEHVDEIAGTPGVDGLFIGPGDLGLRLRRENRAADMDDCVRCVSEAAERHGKAWGLPVSSREQMERFSGSGAQLLNRVGEFHAIMQTLNQGIADFENLKVGGAHA
ncbi:MAG: 4-hydroxy-2-oxovalerate aldolase [Planctomycetota bacterium]|nr:MAG: 4-hydroxy-2-oxovalerate aldolase [Planctomycetota bacterium]REJ88429.1 MAG: 4-hydroxy-2-oxovalerate aldolase [Planctomycetota bacterium]REK24860.1 MAG: 4-hydroxy-2-oxovalerate aldolase [Planctomycetota bacterium]REK40131.1 MAG: 4-hydroxy-2-oxovalerate aldolase [Planctomycetota bacterium]